MTSAHSILLTTPIQAQDGDDFARKLRDALAGATECFPTADYCMSDGAGQDTEIIAVTVDESGATEVRGTIQVRFTEHYPVGCADLRPFEQHQVGVRFRYHRDEHMLQLERGYPKREYEPEEF